MTDISILWLLAGLATGGLHAWLVWSGSQPPFHSSVAGMVRLLLIGGLLVVTAVNGGILPAAAGWATAFPVVAGAIYLRSLVTGYRKVQ
ncbi:hypothetical protein GC176_03795 [bacterium]|nr:hypothetical protein [bacterium]